MKSLNEAARDVLNESALSENIKIEVLRKNLEQIVKDTQTGSVFSDSIEAARKKDNVLPNERGIVTDMQDLLKKALKRMLYIEKNLK